MKDIKGKTIAELEKMLAEKREALRVFRFDTAAGKVKNVKLGKGIRLTIANILTEINSQKVK